MPTPTGSSRRAALLASALFLALAPGTVAVFVPWWISRWRVDDPLFGLSLFRWAGLVLIGLGAVGLLDSVARFAVQGLGTPAPVYPTRRAIVSGLYRYVRNPMYVAVVSMILGQGLLLGNAILLGYGASVWLVFHAFVVLYEEPTLRRSFGADYQRFCAAVPRWIPRLTPRKARCKSRGCDAADASIYQ